MCNCYFFTDWQSEFGGFTCYVANEEDEEVSFDLELCLFLWLQPV